MSLARQCHCCGHFGAVESAIELPAGWLRVIQGDGTDSYYCGFACLSSWAAGFVAEGS